MFRGTTRETLGKISIGVQHGLPKKKRDLQEQVEQVEQVEQGPPPPKRHAIPTAAARPDSTAAISRYTFSPTRALAVCGPLFLIAGE
jgi:hypothetical protein